MPENPTLSRDELIQLCADGIVPQKDWRNRDSSGAQIQLGQARALLASGCEFYVLHGTSRHSLRTDEETIWVSIQWFGFDHFEYGRESGMTEDDTFYIPTRARLDAAAGKDWY